MPGLYIHIPFCRQKCHYCNFLSVVSRSLQKGFLSALRRETEIQQSYLGGEEIGTIYFGGGTPSIIEPGEIASLLSLIRQYYPLSSEVEITLEVNPDDVKNEVLSQWKDAGINRISLGVQSFQDKELIFLHRSHDSKKARSAIEQTLKNGFTNISVDLIYNIPGQQTDDWKFNLNEVKNYNIPHLSAYWLTVEKGTALDKLIARKILSFPQEDTGIAQFRLLQQWAAENEYIHYEISNLGKSGFFSKHNTGYWNGSKYLGLGPSAHSYNGNNRQWNISSVTTYIDQLSQGYVPSESEVLTPLMRYEEQIMTGLRTMWGVNTEYLEFHFGKKILLQCLHQASSHLEKGNLLFENKHLKLSEEAFLIADHIIMDLFIEPEEWDLLS